jgi:hypothetical protein
MTYREWMILAEKARSRVCYAVKKGRLPDLLKINLLCSRCEERRAVQYDHRDYLRPLKVTPVCQSCNYELGYADNPKFPGRPEGDDGRYWRIRKTTTLEVQS